MSKLKLEYTGNDSFRALMTIYNDNDEIVKSVQYDNDIKFGHDLTTKIMTGNIYSKRVVKDNVILKDDNGIEFEIKDIDNLHLTNVVKRKLVKSFVNIYKKLLMDEYQCIYLLASKDRFGIDRLSSSPSKRDTLTVMCELELDTEGKLTEDSVQLLDMLVNTELSSSTNMLSIDYNRSKLEVSYGEKVLVTTSNQIIEHIKPKVEEFQQNYIESRRSER